MYVIDAILTSEIEALGYIDDVRNCFDYGCCGAWRVAETDKLMITHSKQIDHMSGQRHRHTDSHRKCKHESAVSS